MSEAEIAYYDHELHIPRPPSATDIAFCKITGKCVGIVVATADHRGRTMPVWNTKAADFLIVWDGTWVEYRKPETVTLEWKMD